MTMQQVQTPAGAAPRGDGVLEEVPRGPRPAAPPAMLEDFRDELMCELEMMARHLCSGGGALDPQTIVVLRRLESGERPTIKELAEAHGALAALVAPATPRAIRALQEGTRMRGWGVLLGPTAPIRRLTIANLFFALLFFGISLSPAINEQTISLSIYDQSGTSLLTKLVFLLAAAGLGASFGALFEVWQEIAEGRFDPITESTHWMRIGLGLVAGLTLSELVTTGRDIGGSEGFLMAEPILALIGGFSARLLHMIVNRLIAAVETAFDPGRHAHYPGPGRPPLPPPGLPAAAPPADAARTEARNGG